MKVQRISGERCRQLSRFQPRCRVIRRSAKRSSKLFCPQTSGRIGVRAVTSGYGAHLKGESSGHTRASPLHNGACVPQPYRKGDSKHDV